MYTLYKFHFLNGISEINQLFDDILIIWPAPVYTHIYISYIALETTAIFTLLNYVVFILKFYNFKYTVYLG